jgi:hypothetical protein
MRSKLISEPVSGQPSEDRKHQKTAPRQDIGGPELSVTRMIVMTTSRVVNKRV